MRRLIALGALALLVLAAVPFTSAGAASVTKHVDGTVVVLEPASDRTWLARFEVRTTPSGAVDFGYFELYVIGGEPAGGIHEFTVDQVDYYKTPSGAKGATLHMQECKIVPPSQPCFYSPYEVSDGSTVSQDDTLMAQLGWIVQSGNISIYTTGGQNTQ